ncbi:MAG: tetratricopeptide repeat protein [Sulfurimonas sp.]|jgi:TolA-binding protein
MNNSILVAFIVAIASSNIIAAEPSAFGSGNFDDSTPYGQISNERVVSENKNNLQKSSSRSNNQNSDIDSIRERIDGLQSIIESLSAKTQSNKAELNKLTEKNSDVLRNSDVFGKRLSDVNQNNAEDIAKLKLIISELSKLIDKINKSYVTKDEFNILVDEVNKFKEPTSKESKNKAATKKNDVIDNTEKADKSSKAEKTDLDKMSTEIIDTKAKEYFDNKNYDKSTEYYSYLIDKNYKPAVAHYMIGEINFKRKNYSEAVAYYKKSTSLFPKASYMPTLLLHAGISMDNSGDKKNANAFYEGLIAKFPDTKEAEEAKKHLKSTK